MSLGPVARRSLGLLLVSFLAACGDDEPPQAVVYPPLNYDYLTKLHLNVASVTVDNAWDPGAGDHVEYLSPVRPVDALEQLGHERLVASGNSGSARFVIQDASILAGPGRLDGALAVRLEVSTSDGTSSGYAEAKVVRSLTGGPGDPDGGRQAAYDLTKRMMDDMNVELEYQIRRTLRDYLLATSSDAPLPGPVHAQDLAPPSGTTAAPPTYAPTLAPTPLPPLAPPGS